ncbi:MAG: FGGY-family carbohydrate kinase [Anaerolineales bacterium]|nr:FGGY-family carbohydrate kinase [Anaerolineales bacterium]
MYLMGIDMGTTATKIILIDLDGHVVTSVEKPATLLSQYAGWAEEDANQWWRNVQEGVPECIRIAGIDASQIAAVGTSGMVPTIVLLDKDDQVLRNSIQQNDARAVDEIEYLRSKTDAADILRRTGSAITQQTIGTKILWLRRHEPQVLEKAAHLMGSYEFIAHRLTGVFYIERNWALESGYFDLYKEDWDDDILALSTINRNLLADVHWPSDIIGHVTPHAASLTGLKTGTPVVAGSADHIASSFSSGLKNQGDLLVKLGGAGDIMISMDDIVVDERLFLDYHDIPGKYIASGCMASSGSLIKWFRNQFAPQMDYPDLDKAAEPIPAGSDGLILLPYFLGEKTPIQDPLARGTLVGLTLTHTSAHVYRAVLEGISYGFYHHLMVLAEHGMTPTKARCANGGARSALWKQVTADVLGIRLEQVADHPGSSLGAAFCAGMGVGAFKRWDEIERYIKISTITEPDPENHIRYQKLFKLYREIYESLKGTFPRLAEAIAG